MAKRSHVACAGRQLNARIQVLTVILCFVSRLFLIYYSASSQKWIQTFGEPNNNEESRQIIEHYDYGYIVTCLNFSTYDNLRGWLIKTDINGNSLNNLFSEPDFEVKFLRFIVFLRN